jgi:hypothetical protein
MPEIRALGAMKAYALGRRSKWKDYVDLYFLLRDHSTLPDLILFTKTLFRGAFNSKLFVEQLCYFDDVDMTEQVEFTSEAIPETAIKEWLTVQAMSV